MMTPEMSPTIGPTIPIISFGELGSGIEFIIAASRAWPARYLSNKKMCAAVIHTVCQAQEQAMKKMQSGRLLAMTQAQKRKVNSQQAGSMFDGMKKTVQMPMASPKQREQADQSPVHGDSPL